MGRAPESYADALDAVGLEDVRLGLVTELLSDAPEGRVVSRVVERAVSELRRDGAEVVEQEGGALFLGNRWSLRVRRDLCVGGWRLLHARGPVAC